MITLKDVMLYIKTLNFGADYYSIAKIDGNKEKSVGVYQMKSTSPNFVALGKETKTDTKRITILIHWNKNASQTEDASIVLFNMLANASNVTINGHNVNYIQLLNNEPIDVGVDEKGVYERVIDVVFHHER